MDQKNVFVPVITLFIGALAGFVLGRSMINGVGAPDAEIVKLRSQIEQAKKFFPQTPQDVRTLSGVVKSVGGNAITLETSSVSPFEGLPKVRMITISNTTKIVQQKQKDPAVYQKELSAFQEATKQGIKPGSAPPIPPQPFQDVSASFEDIKAGAGVTVTAAENIRDKERFEAVEVRITFVPLTSPSAQFPFPR